MAEKISPNDLVTFREALVSEIIASEALVNLLERKGLITKQELMEEINKVQASIPKAET
jgi:tellurite resistance protein